MRAFSSSFQLCILLILIFQSIEKSCGDFDVIVGVVQALNGSESVAAQVASEILVGTRMAIDKINRENWINGSISILEQDTGTQRVSAIQAGLNLLDPLRTSVKVMLMVGAQTSSTAQLISPYGEIFHTPLFSYWASADDLSSSSRFPYFHRKFPSNLEEATAIIQLISHYKWTTLGVIFSDGDDFSASLANFINQLAREAGFLVASFPSFPEDSNQDDSKLRDAVSRLYQSNVRIIVLIGYSESALKILKIASSPEFDMFNGNYVWIGTRNWIFDGRVSEAGFPGLIGTMIYVNHSHPLLLEFVESWSQKFRKSPGDVFYVPESFIGILGFDYTLFAGHAISTLIQYNASCFQRLNVSKSLCDLLKNNQTQEELILNCCSSYLEDYGIILSYLLQNLTYRGSSSYLRPDSKDEYVSSALGIVNINNRKKKYVGVFFDGELQMDEKEEAIWQDGTTNIPSDKPDLTEFIKAIPLGVIIPYWVLASFGIILAVGVFTFNIYFVKHSQDKMYAPLVNNLTVFGCFLSFTLVFMNGLDDRFLSMTTLENFCYTRLWWYAIGFSFIMAPLVAKAYRINKIFNSRRIRLTRIPDFHLFWFVGFIVAVNVAVLLVWTLVSGSRVKTFVNSADNTKSADSENSQDLNSIWLTIPNAQEVEIYNQCDFLSNSSSIFMAILITWNFSLTVSGAYLAIQIRQVTQALSDAVHVSFCIYNVIIVTLVCLPAILTVNNGATVSFIIQCTGLVAIAFSVLLLLFIPPLRSLRQQRKQKKDRMLEQSKSALSDDSKLSEYYEKAPSNARIFSSSVMVSSRDPYKESRSITVEDSLSGLSKAELLLEVEYLRNLVQDMKQQTFKRTEKPLGLDPAEDA